MHQWSFFIISLGNVLLTVRNQISAKNNFHRLLNFICFVVDTINTLRPRQNGRYFADNIFECIFLNENVLISFKISLKFVPKGQINNIPALA